ncbi:TRAUB-domain-containing protein [Lophiostoma macrostomum CBS 122681]|uniref:Protein BFR2 n=1 Tax=Lophiostoma macrostomum CBS 122681 TaxID=1314788 RepID=A0A6A6SS28_9PLEO|nr:TRAUB-domain-containing protein [Lophiostoma macrostomum CBS 122681]
MKKSKIRDFDPESLLDPAPSSSEDDDAESGFSSEEDVDTGREHYEDVSKSKLRKKEVVPLGPQYTGSMVSRDVVEDEDSDDPFAKQYDVGESEEEEEEDNVAGELSDVKTGSQDEEGASYSEEGDSEAHEGLEDDASDDEMVDGAGHDTDDQDMESEGSEDQDDEDNEDEDTADQTSKLREMMKDTSLVTSAISQAAKSDVEKGQAIKRQRKTFDTLLNARIRLQKALISTNSMATDRYSSENAPDTVVGAAESAALKLLNNLTDLRSSLDEARTGQKRKRAAFTSDTPASDIWSSIHASESGAHPSRKAILEKWSVKTRGASLSSGKGRLNTTAQQTLTDVLDSQLQDSTRLVARTRVPRSCAPLQSAANVSSSENIYDDADFYGLLLKELLENRSNELNANGSASEFVVQAPWQVAREAKTKKIVDTKASKGRKLRYTVHEKLQNFMAPEDRGSWGDRQREELFGGLFGRRVGLGEEEDVQSEEEDGVDVAEEGLMLFRS